MNDLAPKLAYTIPEAARAVSYSVETIRLALRHGDLRASYANTKPVVRASELQRWLDSLPDEEPTPLRKKAS